MNDMLNESAKDYLLQSNKRLREARAACKGLRNHDTIYARGIERLADAHNAVCEIWRDVLKAAEDSEKQS